MKKIAFALAAVTLGAMAAQAQTTGVAVCDDFLVKYETCVNTKVPAAQQAALKTQVEQLKKTFTDLSKNANSKPALEATCKASSDQMKAAMTSYGCSF
jgi:hypothetical protein